jgi:hypothetical protein
MDQEWMYIGNRVRQYFIEGLETFLATGAEYITPKTRMMFTTYVAHVLIAVMRKRLKM